MFDSDKCYQDSNTSERMEALENNRNQFSFAYLPDLRFQSGWLPWNLSTGKTERPLCLDVGKDGLAHLGHCHIAISSFLLPGLTPPMPASVISLPWSRSGLLRNCQRSHDAFYSTNGDSHVVSDSFSLLPLRCKPSVEGSYCALKKMLPVPLRLEVTWQTFSDYL